MMAKKNEIGDVMPLLLIGAGVLFFDTIKKVFTGLGFWDSADTKNLDNVATNPLSFWNPNYYKQFSTTNFPYSRSMALRDAIAINDSFNWYNDCEECAKSVFKSLQSKTQVSILASVFQEKYGQDLLSFLRGGVWPQDRLSDADVNEINNFINKLPKN